MRIKSLPSIESMDGSQDALVIEQTDGSEDKSRKVSPAQLKQYVQTGDFEATGEVKDGHGNILKNMAKSVDVDAEIGDLSQTGLTGDSVAEQLGDVNNKVNIVSNISPGPNLTMLRGVYVKIGTLVNINLVCRATGAITPDSAIGYVPTNYMVNAPLNIFINAQLVSGANCRIYNGAVRAGANISSGTEFCIQGSYISMT